MSNQLGSNLFKAAEEIKKREEEDATRKLANSTSLPYVSLTTYPITADILRLFPTDIIKNYKVAPYLRVKKQIKVATPDPRNVSLPNILKEMAQTLNLEISLNVCSPRSFSHILNLVDQIPEEIDRQKQIKREEEENPSDIEVDSLADLPEKITRVSTTQTLDVVIATALKINASDIHIEPEETSARIRFRIDGVLQEVANIDSKIYKQINSRLKFMAKLKLDKSSIAQDGRFTFTGLKNPVDIRLSSLPGIYGESFVLRLLATQAKFLKLVDMGFRDDAINIIAQEIQKPNGLVLNTGPTGSGKTTTLYAIISTLNQPGVKIITLEDPIEYRLQGIDQVQVAEGKVTFADGLRAILRQDPDIIMVGEIRDGETATIAIQAAMTGHMVLSTLHTNNAPAALVRLVEMGIEPYMLSGAINLVVAQRLVRRICTTCQGTGQVGNSLCPACNGIKYKGRIGIIELLKPTREIEQLVINRAPLGDIINMARSQGMVTLQEDGMQKVAQGLTTEEEVQRVTQDYSV